MRIYCFESSLAHVVASIRTAQCGGSDEGYKKIKISKGQHSQKPVLLCQEELLKNWKTTNGNWLC